MPAAPLPDGLLDRLRADPMHAVETIALAAAERHGPAARTWLERQPARRRRRPARMARRTVRFHAYLSRATGAAAGFGGALTMAPDMASLAWMQSRMLVFIAAAYGLDPNDRERAAEILVLQQVARDLPSARAALDGSGPTIASHYVDGKLSGNEGLVRVLTRTIFRHGAHRLAGRAIPGFAIFYNSWANARATRVLGRRARRWYKEHANELPARAAAAEPARVSA